MTDIVERLRTSTEWAHCKHSMREEAAAEIERLRAALSDCLECLTTPTNAISPSTLIGACERARRALEPKP